MTYMMSNNAIEHDRQFIRQTLGSNLRVVLLCYFCFIAGIAALVGLIAANWLWSLPTVLLTSLVAFLLWYPKIGHWRALVSATLVGCIGVLGITLFAHGLHYSTPTESVLWILNKRTTYLGRQINFGVILGLLVGALFTGCVALYYEAEHKTTISIFAALRDGSLKNILLISLIGSMLIALVLWLIIGTIAPLFNWGFGWGAHWYAGWFLAIPLGSIGGTGLSIFSYISAKWYKPHWFL